jgi:hypothetical protein
VSDVASECETSKHQKVQKGSIGSKKKALPSETRLGRNPSVMVRAKRTFYRRAYPKRPNPPYPKFIFELRLRPKKYRQF